MSLWQDSSQLYKKKLNLDKKSLTETWNQFIDSLARTFADYYAIRKIMIGKHIVSLRNNVFLLKQIPILKLLLAALPLISYLILFSFYKNIRHVTHLDKIAPPNYAILSNIERRLFFCHPHRILSKLTNPIFDILAAIPYLIHFPLPFLFLAYLAFAEKRRPAILPYLWCVGWVDLIGVIIQFTFPTAPPWFTDSAVLEDDGDIIYEYASEAGFKRLDTLIGVNVFHHLYATSPLKFGAFPSLHVAIPMVIFLNHPWFGKKFAAFHVAYISLAAMYITHHYFVDALGGILLATVVKLFMVKFWSPFPEMRVSNGTGSQSDKLEGEKLIEASDIV